MRMAVVIIALAAIAVALVHLRRAELSVRHETQELRTQQVGLRRELWDLQNRAGQLTAPGEINRRRGQMALDLKDNSPTPGTAPARLADRSGARDVEHH